MNLKESFRYQNFLDSLMREASASIQVSEHCLKVTRKHLRNNVNPEATDYDEVVEDEAYFANDHVIAFMLWLVNEREKLCNAITIAKASVGFDLDAAVETNKFRQSVSGAIKNMLRYAPSKRIAQGRDYRFNNEGNQMPYVYDVEIVSEEAYDRALAKKYMRSIVSEADKTSAKIDAAMINTTVDYEPSFDVNESFSDVMTDFIDKFIET